MKSRFIPVGIFCLAAGPLLAGPPGVRSRGLWSSAAELQAVPMAGPAWAAVMSRASEDQSHPDVANQNDPTNIRVLASSIVFARTSDISYREKVIRAIGVLTRRGNPGGRTLAWARKTGAYALAADLVGYSSPEFDRWLKAMAESYVGSDRRTLLQMFRERPNNWGTQAFGSLVAIYAYLNEDTRLREVRAYYLAGITGPNPGFRYGQDLSWQADPHDPRIINPAGAAKDGMNIDGVEPEELRRGAPFRLPPVFTGYAWEGLQGHVLAARVLERLGLSIWDAGDRALYRAAYRLQVGFGDLYGEQWRATGDDEWMLPFFDEAYGTQWNKGQSRVWDAGKNTGFGYVIAGDRYRSSASVPADPPAALSSGPAPPLHFRSGHPRLLLTDEALAAAVAAAKSDPLRAELHRQIIAAATKELSVPAVSHRIVHGEMLDQSRAAVRTILTCAMAYRLTGDRRFADRAKEDMMSAAAFPDWNPAHFLDVGEMSFAVALGYDWLQPELDAGEKAAIKRALLEKALVFSRDAYDPGGPKDKHLWWATETTNWNQVCNGGLVTAALALADEEPALAALVVSGARRSLSGAMAEYRPDGAYPEGPGYWTYGTTYNVIALAEFEGVLGTDFGLGRSPAFDRTALYRLAVQGPTGLSFNYADAPPTLTASPAYTWLARRYANPAAQENSRNLLAQAMARGTTSDRFFALQAVWFPEAVAAGAGTPAPLDLHFRGVADIALFRSAWNDPLALFVGFKAGANSFHHAHLDLGSFVLDAEGERWSLDLGGDAYSLPGYFDFKAERWGYFRLNNHGHSTVAPGDALQRRDAVARIVSFGSRPAFAFAVADLTSAYPDEARSLRRGIALLDRSRVLVQDEFLPARAGIPLHWQMVTGAGIAVSADGRSALLTRDGKTLRADVLSPGAARFHIGSTRPPTPAENQNQGTAILAVDAAPSQAGTVEVLAVLLTPVGRNWTVLAPPAIEPLSHWGAAPRRPYSDDSPWNTPLPARPAIAPDSAALIRTLGRNFGASVVRFTMPVYEISQGTPLKTVNLSGLFSVVAGDNSTLTRRLHAAVRVPMPDGARPAAGSDAQIILWDEATGDEWGFWQARETADGAWSAVNGYRYDTDWSGIPPRTRTGEPFGSRGAGVPYLTGLIRPWEIKQGRIEHAIAFAYQDTASTHVAPATKSDGKRSGMPEGMRLQLDPSYENAGLTRSGRIVADAMKKYGMILIDAAGHPKIYAEYQGTAGWKSDPDSDLYWSEDVVTTIPYTRFRVVRTSPTSGQPVSE